MAKNKTIGVLGGMGPEASVNLYAGLVKYAQKGYGAVQDNDYPPVILYSIPLEGFDETGIVDTMLVKTQLIEGVKKLESAGCDLVILGCNTVHVFYHDLQASIKIPILNIVAETKARVLRQGFKKVGLFASETTVNTKLYQENFAKSGISVFSPNKAQQKVITTVIEHVMGGRQGPSDTAALKSIASDYVKKGAEAIIVGCTEIPLAIGQEQFEVPLFDTTSIIVQAAVDFSLTGQRAVK